MSDACFHHLVGIYLLGNYEYRQNAKLGELFQREFYFLKNRGFIWPETLEFDAVPVSATAKRSTITKRDH